MDSSSKKKQEEKINSEPLDPFAVDIFRTLDQIDVSQESGLTAIPTLPLPENVYFDWSQDLRRVDSEDLLSNRNLSGDAEWIVELYSEALFPAFRGLSADGAETGHLEVISTSNRLPQKRILGEGSSSIEVLLSCRQRSVSISLSCEMVNAFIERLLGGNDTESVADRSLSAIEVAIVEYLAAIGVAAVNSKLDSVDHFRLDSIESSSTRDSDSDSTTIEIVGDVVFGDLSGLVSFYVPQDIAAILDKAFGKDPGDETDSPSRKRTVSHIQSLPTSLQIGRTSLPAAELPFLESGDVILVAEPHQEWWSQESGSGAMMCCVGKTDNTVLKMSVSEEFEFRIEGFSNFLVSRQFGRYSRESFRPGTETLDDFEESDGDEESVEGTSNTMAKQEDERSNLVALENVMVDLRVQVAGKKLSLEEVGSLRTGQILDLGCRPEDPVELVVDNNDRSIGTGELVKIDDRLGVRILKLFV